MKKRILYFYILLSLMFSISAQEVAKSRLSVSGNQFTNPAGDTVVLRGYSSSDPDKLESQGLWSKAYFEEMKTWGANVVRFPIHPPRWRSRGKENYLKLLDQGIEWATQNNLYVILDWHSIGNLRTERFFKPIYKTSLQETQEFWKLMASRYGDNPTVAFYELYNEPTTINGQLGTCSWTEWKSINEGLISIVRSHGGEGIPLIAGFNWAYDLISAYENPIDAKGIGYVSHPYPQKRTQPWEEKWTTDWGKMKTRYPVILTEVGFAYPEEKGAHVPVISDESYGNALTDYCDKRSISYVVWVFDAQWSPSLFSNWEYLPTKQGEFFKEKLNSYYPQ